MVGRFISCILFLLAAATARAAEYPLLPGQTAIGGVTTYVVSAEETMMDVARAHGLGFTELMAANRQIDPWLPPDGATIVIPAFHILPDGPREGIVVNVAERRLFYFHPDDKRVETFPVGIGRLESATPEGATKVVRTQRNPSWYPTSSALKENPDLPWEVPPGPRNPLGTFAFYLGWPTYLIHGTNQPDGIGRAISHGCIQMYPEDIERLAKVVKIGTSVRIVNDEISVAIVDGQLYATVALARLQAEALEAGKDVDPEPMADLAVTIGSAAASHDFHVNWAAVETAALVRDGLPVLVGRRGAVLELSRAEIAWDDEKKTDEKPARKNRRPRARPAQLAANK